jgi:hypothetical protein
VLLPHDCGANFPDVPTNGNRLLTPKLPDYATVVEALALTRDLEKRLPAPIEMIRTIQN